MSNVVSKMVIVSIHRSSFGQGARNEFSATDELIITKNTRENDSISNSTSVPLNSAGSAGILLLGALPPEIIDKSGSVARGKAAT